MHQSVVVETAPLYFTSNHQPLSASTISLSNGEIVNYNDFDNYTMHTIQQKIIETSSTYANSPPINKRNTTSITNGGFSSSEKHNKPLRPDLNHEGAGLYRQNTELEARDSSGQPFRQSRSSKYGHVKSKVDSNLHNLSLRRPSGRNPHEGAATTATTSDTNENNYSSSVINNQSLPSSFISPTSNSSINKHNKDITTTDGKESRVQTGLAWRKPTILVGPSSSTTHHHLNNLQQQQQQNSNNNRIRSLSASPNVQHADPSSSTTGKSSLEPIKSELSPLRSRSASMEYSLQPNDFDTYLQKSTNIIMANGESSNSSEKHRNAKDSIRLYRSYIHKKRNPLHYMDDVFENRMKELEQRNITLTQQQHQHHQQQHFPSFETSVSTKQTSEDNNHQQTPEDFVRVMPLMQPTLPRFDLHAPSKKMARPISEHFTSSTDRRSHMSGNLPSIHQQRPASEYYKTSQSADINNNNRLSFSLPDPRSNDFYHHQRHQDQHFQLQENYKDTFNYLKGDYLKEDEKRRAMSLDSAQKKNDLSQSLSRQAGMILQRLQGQQQQREQEDVQRRQLEEKNAEEKEKKLKEQRRLAAIANEQKILQRQQEEIHRQNIEEQQRRLHIEQQRQHEHNVKKMHDEQGSKQQQKRADEQKKYHDQLGDQYRFYEHQRNLREQQEYQRALLFDKHQYQQQQQQQQQTPVLHPAPQKPVEENSESNSSLRKAELSLAENIRFLKQLQSHHNKSLPPIPPPSNTFKSTTSSHSTSEQSPTTLPLTWGRQDTMDLLKHSKFNHTNNNSKNNNIHNNISDNINNNKSMDIRGPVPKKSALKKSNRTSNTLRGMAPSYFNYATSSYLSSSHSDLPKPPKKSVKIVLEKNSFHFYPKDIW